ncbi:hypothetical protein ANCCEY_03470 [Ancylostoma ceylanicum]|uniref:Uncharacterized protein n=1 Tax=Ancylostoma ceylanicum TaxID=53326 RepID=A0A0D6MB78_9BILA|nr:hypothetical protein ANCCEY_03470 [Ancylostoma ceylanicum]
MANTASDNYPGFDTFLHKRPLNYAELSIQQDLDQGTTDIFDEYLTKEFGALEIEIPTSGEQPSRIIPFFQNEDILTTPPPPTTSAPTQSATKPQTTTAPSPSTIKIRTTTTMKATPTSTTIKTPIITTPPPRPTTTTTITPTPTTIIAYITRTTPILFTTPTSSPTSPTTITKATVSVPPYVPPPMELRKQKPIMQSTLRTLSKTTPMPTTTFKPTSAPVTLTAVVTSTPTSLSRKGFSDFYEDFPHYSALIPQKPLVMVEKSTSNGRKDSPPYNSELENRIAHSITFASANI